MAGSSVGVGPRGDIPDPIESFTTSVANIFTTESENVSFYGPRGDTWKECVVWFEAMPGAFFQLGNLFLLLAYMAGGNSEVCAIFTHFMGMLAFLSFAIWGYIGACSYDVIGWSLCLFLVNLIQLIVTCRRSRKIQSIMGKDGMGHLHASRFSPFDISQQLFVDLVTCKGCEITHMDSGSSYAVEKTTPVHKISFLISGRMKVLCNGKFIHYITPDSFIDSTEWDSIAKPETSNLPLFKVTIVADTPCTFISWKRKGLLALLSKHKRLNRVLSLMIAKDVTSKLYALNDRCITERGFRYDIRLPCVMSLPDDVERRAKTAAAASHSAPGTPGTDAEGRRHRQKRLGKTAAAKYAKIFASKLRARVSMRGIQKPAVIMRREPLKEED